MAKFRKKPVVIEAWHVTEETLHQPMPDWMFDAFTSHKAWSDPGPSGVSGIYIVTLEGTMRADIGDWIIRGVKGELYPCKPDIFDATYDPVPSPEGEANG